MPALEGSVLGGVALEGATLEGVALGGSTEPAPNPLFSWGTDFTKAPADPTDSGWLIYKETAVASAVCEVDGLLLEVVQGGGGDYLAAPAPTGAFWYSSSNADQHSGPMVYKIIGPDGGTSISWDVRARLLVRNSAGTASPPLAAGEWRAAVLAVHDPDRTAYLRYAHVGPIAEGLVPELGLELKLNRVNATGGSSRFPVITHPGGDLDYDVRIVRRESNHQILELHHRLVSSGEPLESEDGWTLDYVIDWLDGTSVEDTFPSSDQEIDPGLPDTVHVGIYVYSNAVEHDVRVTCPQILATPTTA